MSLREARKIGTRKVYNISFTELHDAIGQRELDLYGLSTGSSTSTVRKNHATEPPARKGQEGALKPLDYLEAEHPAVEAVGFDPATASHLSRLDIAIGAFHAGEKFSRLAVQTVDLRDVMTSILARIPGHDEAPAARAPVPDPTELKADIEAIENWVAKIRKRRS